MKTFSKISFLFLLLTASTALMYWGCEPEEPNDPTDIIDQYTGTWISHETSTQFPDPITFSVEITKDPVSSNGVLISNFYHLGYAASDRVKATVTRTTITIPVQTVCNMTINGTGTYSGNKINLLYYVNDGADIDEVTAVYSK